MASGYLVDQDIVKQYASLKIKSGPNKGPRYFTMLVDIEKSAIVLGDVGERSDCCKTDLEKFASNLPKDEPLYVCFDMEFTSTEGQDRKKPVFINWCPDKCSVKKKMLAAASTEALKKKFEGLGATIHATDHEDVTFDYIKSRIKKF